MPRRPLFPLVLLAALVLTGCTTAPASPSTPTKAPSPAPSISATGDGTLVIGTLFALTGDQSDSGAAQVAGAELAIRDILGEPSPALPAVQLIHRNSEGDLTATYAELVARGVDVVLWDATTAVPADAAAAVGAAPFVALRDYVNDDTLLVADDAFAARLKTADPGLTDTGGGAEAYDGVIAVALAALITGDDGAASLTAGLPFVTSGSAVCASWGECALAITEEQIIDYQGMTARRS